MSLWAPSCHEGQASVTWRSISQTSTRGPGYVSACALPDGRKRGPGAEKRAPVCRPQAVWYTAFDESPLLLKVQS